MYNKFAVIKALNNNYLLNNAKALDGKPFIVHYSKAMIEVTRLDGKSYWINPHQIEYMEKNPDLTLTLLSGKKVVVREPPEEVIERIVAYRRKIGINQEL